MTRTVRRIHLLVIGAALSLLVAACAHTLEPGSVGVRVECNISDATVYIDDLMVGRAADWKAEGHQIRGGFHRIEVRAPGYYSFFQEIELPAGAHAVINANLREVLD
ncbi:MAG TPA: PEGA domain-containing protein [Polyangia bacterium]|nr:PEGA domain-containing protein [Polyangia bacterium]